MNAGGDYLKQEVPIANKYGLTIDEAAEYFGVGTKRLRELAADPHCDFVLRIGTKRLIKRVQFEKYLDNQYVL